MPELIVIGGWICVTRFLMGLLRLIWVHFKGTYLTKSIQKHTIQMINHSKTAQKLYSWCIYVIYGLYMSSNYSNEVDKDSFKFL